MSGTSTGPSAGVVGTGVSGFVNGIGGAVGDLMTASGDRAQALGDTQAAAAFGTASNLATQDVNYEEQSTRIQQVQAQRQITQTLGSQRAEVAGAGFESSGSSLSLLASSAQQGAMTTAMIGVQGQILANGYQQQAQAYTAQQDSALAAATAASDAASAATAGAATSAIAGVAALIPLGSFL